MTLMIDDPEAQRLAHDIAQVTKETTTHAITAALRERYERLQRSTGTASVELFAIAQRAAAHGKRPYLDHAELLYDEHGWR